MAKRQSHELLVHALLKLFGGLAVSLPDLQIAIDLFEQLVPLYVEAADIVLSSQLEQSLLILMSDNLTSKLVTELLNPIADVINVNLDFVFEELTRLFF